MIKNTIIIFYGLFSEKQSYDWIPYGPLFLYSMLKSKGFNPILIHEYNNRNYEKTIIRYEKDTIAFCISAMTGYQIKSGIKAVKLFKKHNDKSPVLWGGAHATAIPYNTLKSKYVDYVYVGYTTFNLIKFFENIKNKNSVSGENIPDLLNLNDFNRLNAKSYKVEDNKLDLYTFPKLSFNDFNFFYLLTENMVLNYNASIGCPGVCTFCSWGGEKHPWTKFKLNRVLDELEYLVKTYGLKSVWFSDSELSIEKNFLLGIAKGLIDRKINIYWRCNARVVELKKYTKKDYELLEKSGLDRFFLGVENIDNNIQKTYRKIIKPEWVFNLLKNLNNFNIQIMLAFIFGNPNEHIDSLEKNRAFLSQCYELNCNVRFQISFFTPYPGTPLTDYVSTVCYDEPKNLEEYGNSLYFTDVSRSYKKMPWMERDEAKEYIQKYNILFPTMDCAPEWNWREKV
ncbi:MAG: radical SAM protein [Deltaproteobacteria bacterium]|nr:radical SAM protein [Deltaproteobacteria bacterium]